MDFFAITDRRQLFRRIAEKAQNTRIFEFLVSSSVATVFILVVSVLLYFEQNWLAFGVIFTAITTFGYIVIKEEYDRYRTLHGYDYRQYLIEDEGDVPFDTDYSSDGLSELSIEDSAFDSEIEADGQTESVDSEEWIQRISAIHWNLN